MQFGKAYLTASLSDFSTDQRRRYFRFFLLLLSAGAIYPLLYLRQNFETTVLSAFGITGNQLGECYSVLGVVYALTYLPSGWLADRVSPRVLISFSLAAVGGLGLWFATFPAYPSLMVIFIGWGIAAGLTFWAALIKAVTLLAGEKEQGRFFGTLDGGRGLVEAVLASMALGLFAYSLGLGSQDRQALQHVIHLYAFTCLVVAMLVFTFLEKDPPQPIASVRSASRSNVWRDLRTLLGMPRIWLMSLIIFCGYQLFWATYSFSAYLQKGHGMSVVMAGVITVAKLWMRPIGGVGAGYLGDRYSKTGVLCAALILASLGLFGLAMFPATQSMYPLLMLVMVIGVLTYAIRGLYWSVLDDCRVPTAMTGLAIGFISVVGYLPDIILPIVNEWISARYPGAAGYQVYFLYIATMGLVGAAAAYFFKGSSSMSEVSK